MMVLGTTISGLEFDPKKLAAINLAALGVRSDATLSAPAAANILAAIGQHAAAAPAESPETKNNALQAAVHMSRELEDAAQRNPAMAMQLRAMQTRLEGMVLRGDTAGIMSLQAQVQAALQQANTGTQQQTGITIAEKQQAQIRQTMEDLHKMDESIKHDQDMLHALGYGDAEAEKKMHELEEERDRQRKGSTGWFEGDIKLDKQGIDYYGKLEKQAHDRGDEKAAAVAHTAKEKSIEKLHAAEKGFAAAARAEGHWTEAEIKERIGDFERQADKGDIELVTQTVNKQAKHWMPAVALPKMESEHVADPAAAKTPTPVQKTAELQKMSAQVRV